MAMAVLLQAYSGASDAEAAYVAHRERPCRRIVITRIGHRDRAKRR